MTPPLLDAALIVKDESANLPGCLAALQALRPLLHRVVVYDTGSSDDTRELARAGGADVIEGYWDGDFARARNAAIDGTSAPWVLIVDADERVVADQPALRSALAAGLRGSTSCDALVVAMVNETADGEELWAAPQVRVLRSDRARYAGRLHERVEPRRPGGQPLRLTEQARQVVRVRHTGYGSAEIVAAKVRRNLALADAEVAAVEAQPVPDPADLARALYHRGRTLAMAGRAEPALTDLQRLRSLRVGAFERVWGGDVLAQLLLALGRLDETAELAGELRAEGVDGRYCDWFVARTLLARDRFAEALPLLRGVDALVDASGRTFELAPVVEAQMIAAARTGEIDEATACCIRLMAGFGRVEGLGSLLLTLWGERPAEWLVELLAGADGGYLPDVVTELQRCDPPGPQIARALPVG